MTVAVSLSPLFNGTQLFTSGGIPLNSGLINCYQAGGTTPQDTYTTSAGMVKNANPIVLAADGRPPNEVWLVDGNTYRFDLTDSFGNLIKTYDNIVGINSNSATFAASGGSSLVGFIQSGSGATALTVQAALRAVSLTPEQFGAVGNGITDDTAAIQACWNAATIGARILYGPNTYLYTALTHPNKVLVHIGSGFTSTVLKGTGATGIYCGHWGSTDLSSGTLFSNMNVRGDGSTAQVGTNTALRINTDRIFLERVFCSHASIGCEVNRSLYAQHTGCTFYGQTYGKKVCYNANDVHSDNCQVLGNYWGSNSHAGAGQSASGGSAFEVVAEGVATFTFEKNTLDTEIYEAAKYGLRIQQAASAFASNTIINPWVERVHSTGKWYDFVDQQSLLGNVYWRSADGASNSFADSVVHDKSGVYPFAAPTTPATIGAMALPSAGHYEIWGLDVFSNQVVTKRPRLMAWGTEQIASGFANATMSDGEPMAFLVTIAATSKKVATINLSGGGQIAQIRISYSGSTSNSLTTVGFRGEREIMNANDSSSITVNTIGTDYVRGTTPGVTIARVGDNVLSVTLTGLTSGMRLGGVIEAVAGCGAVSDRNSIQLVNET